MPARSHFAINSRVALIQDSEMIGALVCAGIAGVRLKVKSSRSGYTMSNPLWEYSLATYRVKDVAATCLALQDTFDVDVNLLLYAAWLAQMNRCLSAGHLGELDALITEWRDGVVQPLRGLRRQLHGYAQAAGVREELKALELRAEQDQQAAIHTFYQSSAELARADNPLLGNLTLVALSASPDNSDWKSPVRHLASLISL
jgi:uncharacterized protein (TIGR02444 family)